MADIDMIVVFNDVVEDDVGEADAGAGALTLVVLVLIIGGTELDNREETLDEGVVALEEIDEEFEGAAPDDWNVAVEEVDDGDWRFVGTGSTDPKATHSVTWSPFNCAGKPPAPSR